MKKLQLALVVILFLIAGCSMENPKTKNPLLKNKRISWSENGAQYFEFLPDGFLIACGGDFPLEGYLAGEWEGVGENGDFKIMEKGNESGNFLLASVEGVLGIDSKLLLENQTRAVENKGGFDKRQTRITTYEQITNSHEKTAVLSKARVVVTRFKDDVFVLELQVNDPAGRIKKIFTEGDAITTEVMVSNGKKWVNNPPIILSSKWDGLKPVYSKMTILYHDGREETATFQTRGYVDKSEEVFKDPWF